MTKESVVVEPNQEVNFGTSGKRLLRLCMAQIRTRLLRTAMGATRPGSDFGGECVTAREAICDYSQRVLVEGGRLARVLGPSR